MMDWMDSCEAITLHGYMAFLEHFQVFCGIRSGMSIKFAFIGDRHGWPVVHTYFALLECILRYTCIHVFGQICTRSANSSLRYLWTQAHALYPMLRQWPPSPYSFFLFLPGELFSHYACRHVVVTFIFAHTRSRWRPRFQMPTSVLYTRPALPTCIISPVGLSSERRTGHAAASAFTRVNSSFVPSMRYLQSWGLTVP